MFRVPTVVCAAALMLLSIAPRAAAFTDEQYDAHVAELRKRLPSQDFTIVIEKPFVVIGDEGHHVVKLRAVKTVRWAVNLLKKQYFKKDPKVILDIWLFKDKASYHKHCKALWGDTPHTPYGYYSSAKGALVMNISTGGGTLVHEIVHPFIESNFPRCPPWFNEGLGSLYEQCRERDGKIVGMTNWRLPGLQKAILAGNVPSFKQLMAKSPHDFYSRDTTGTNYAQSRYLLYYLQEKGLLQEYYDAFTANHRDDPHGYETLKKVLGVEDVDAFQKQWEGYVGKLKFR